MSRTEVEERVVPFTAGDGFQCSLCHVSPRSGATRGPVLLVHGAGVSSGVFRAPVPTTLVDVLVERGYDVWLEDWRASILLEPNTWNLDQAAVFDHPAAVRAVLAETGATTLKAVVHCQGSCSFTMAAAAGLLPEVTTIVSNAVSLHPVVPRLSRLKNRFFIPLADHLMRYMDPSWGFHAPQLIPRTLAGVAWLAHHECGSMTCRMVSFTYGSGRPALWLHENLNPETHGAWLDRNFRKVPLSFFAQMHRCVEAGHLVSVDGHPELPAAFGVEPPQTDARFVLFAGRRNLCFLPESQLQTYLYLEHHAAGRHTLHVLPDYSHLDVFMGVRAADEVFPLIIDELEKD
jgi:pimeloyl-ACP methyl ester carboxylesterase